MRALSTRLRALERQRARGGRRFIIVMAARPEDGFPAGAIEPFPNGAGFTMGIPAEFDVNPLAGLDRRQRALLGPGDQLVGLSYRYADGALQTGERWHEM